MCLALAENVILRFTLALVEFVFRPEFIVLSWENRIRERPGTQHKGYGYGSRYRGWSLATDLP